MLLLKISINLIVRNDKIILIAYLLHGAVAFLASWPVFAASQEIPHIFIGPESYLPYSQVPATRPYPEPTQSSPHEPLQLKKNTYCFWLMYVGLLLNIPSMEMRFSYIPTNTHTHTHTRMCVCVCARARAPVSTDNKFQDLPRIIPNAIYNVIFV
jgi:hypothetical protein